ncbi:MAG: aminotransferase class I/II-fold pyridoxal phosphate-dependent enzyme [Bacteroidetes bacterium]|nr:aminotransferase class I/II-fold pyridoxal phosphate-dependent enzyme [Bacteroidota bacterium]MDA0879948.1 aminotransferase class I/II-fold pyridoxal phosphate-dependent enzyme [Bacteroidota bacterium]MDA1115295.1 aminotransferase class I/II-fold pyridoxal phosphate-dependent enzyme [Bacteroidota bacterium]
MTAANRLASVQEYYFSTKLQEVGEMRAKGCDIINMGIGSPDLPPPFEAIEALTNCMSDANSNGYQSYRGLPELREAMAQFYAHHFGVDLNPMTEILPLMGSKEGIMHISMAFLNPGDQVLIPNPGYPTYESVSRLVEAIPVFYDLNDTSGWMPNLAALEQTDLSKVKLMWINYPHMPSGAKTSSKTLTELVLFAKKHQILLVNDNPYSLILNDQPLSLLGIPGAFDCSLELNSISKTFNMSGWRVGMVMGGKSLINDILKVKSNMDSGMFYGLQKGSIVALKSDPHWLLSLNKTYSDRRQLVWQLADELGGHYHKDKAGMFVWLKLPEGVNSIEFSDKILKDYHIFTTPGDVFGSNGKGYLRLSLCLDSAQIKRAIERIQQKTKYPV